MVLKNCRIFSTVNLLYSLLNNLFKPLGKIMLVKFSVKNYKQFKDEITFDLSAGNYEFNNECVKNGVVKTALIYGENGTGKTNLGLAMFDLVSHLTDNKSDRLTDTYCRNLLSDNKNIEFMYHFVLNNKNVVYKYSKDLHNQLLEEKLFIDDNLMVDYQLKKSLNVNFQGTEHLNKNINPQQNLSALKYIFSNTNLDKECSENKTFIQFMEFINTILWYRSVAGDKDYIGVKNNSSSNIFTSIIEYGNLKDFENFLNKSGIDCELCVINSIEDKMIAFKLGEKRIAFNYIASTGTMSLALFYYWWQQVEKNKLPLFFIDEFDASYHHELSFAIVEKLKQLPNTQVILTTHNTSLLDNDLIRPDCSFIIDGKQIKSLNHCTERELRMAHNLEKMYRAGGFNV